MGSPDGVTTLLCALFLHSSSQCVTKTRHSPTGASRATKNLLCPFFWRGYTPGEHEMHTEIKRGEGKLRHRHPEAAKGKEEKRALFAGCQDCSPVSTNHFIRIKQRLQSQDHKEGTVDTHADKHASFEVVCSSLSQVRTGST